METGTENGNVSGPEGGGEAVEREGGGGEGSWPFLMLFADV